MKICFISGALPDVSCGIGDYVDALAQALARLNHDVVVLTTESDYLRAPAAYRTVSLRTEWSLRDTGRIAAAARRERPDVLHLQFPGVGFGRGFGASFAPWAVRLRGSAPMPLLVTTLHEFQRFRLRHRARLALAGAACDLLIAPDPTELMAIESSLRWRRGLQTAMIPIAANVWPTTAASESQAGVSDTPLVVGYWGFLREDKGVDLLLEAFAAVRQVRPARLVLAGDPGPEANYIDSIWREAARLGIADEIRTTGRLPAEELSAELQSFDVCVLPFRDGLRKNRGTYAAAVAHGLYVVTTSRDKHGFEEESNTRLVPLGDRDALVAAILEAPIHPKRNNQMTAERTWDEIAALHLAAYESALGKRK
jgi:glycosyltransferase involved in cell wall biosynthesis